MKLLLKNTLPLRRNVLKPISIQTRLSYSQKSRERRNSLANTNNNQSSIFANQTSTSTPTHANSTSSRIASFTSSRTRSLMFSLFFSQASSSSHGFLSNFSTAIPAFHLQQTLNHHDNEDDAKAGLVRFPSGFPSPLAKDTRDWMLDPI